jgi:hypothetical protein
MNLKATLPECISTLPPVMKILRYYNYAMFNNSNKVLPQPFKSATSFE